MTNYIPIRRLGLWTPDSTSALITGPFRELTWSYRDRIENERIAGSEWDRANEWHQDDFGSPMALILWSDDYPTEIKVYGTSEIIRPEPFEVVLIDNLLVHHRVPKDYKVAARAGHARPRNLLRTSVYWSGLTPQQIEDWRYSLAERMAA